MRSESAPTLPPRKRPAGALRVWLLTVLLVVLTPQAWGTHLRVGVYQNPPKVFTDSNGQATGSFIELLREIARSEGWSLRFENCDWNDCLASLEAGEIDLMPDVALTDERQSRFDFHSVPAMHSWSQLYRRDGIKIQSVLDLQGKRIAVLRGGVQTQALVNMLAGFNVQFDLMDVDSVTQAFQAVANGQADVAAASYHFGDYRAPEFGLTATPVMFQPARLYFAAPKGRQADTLARIDARLGEWLQSDTSPYFQVMRHWGVKLPEGPIPQGWRNALLALMALGVALALGVLGLRRSVKRATQALETANQQLTATLRALPDLLFVLDENGTYHAVHAANADLLSAPPPDLLGKSVHDVLPPEAAATVMDALAQARAQGHTHGHLIHLSVPQGKRWFELSVAPKETPIGELAMFIVLSRDITARHEAESQAAYQAKLYAALSDANEAILASHSVTDMLWRVCRSAVDHGGLNMAWAGFLSEDGQRLKPEVSYGEGTEYLHNFELDFGACSSANDGATAVALRTDAPVWCQDFQTIPHSRHWHDAATQFGWRALAALPLHDDDKVVGALVLYSRTEHPFDGPSRQLLMRLARSVDAGVGRFRHEEVKERLQKEMAQRELLFRDLTETIKDVIWVLDPESLRFTYVSPSVRQLRGYTPEEVMAQPMDDALTPEGAKHIRALIARHVAEFRDGTRTPEQVAVEEVLQPCKDGSTVWTEVVTNMSRNPTTGRIEIRGVTRDISARKAADDQIRRLAEFDQLTGLLNRSTLLREFARAKATAQRHHQPLAVFFLDLDHFKHVNDSLGHDVGDALLMQMARRLQKGQRETDLVCRMGGDEFIIVMPDTTEDAATRIATRLSEDIRQPVDIGSHQIRVACSIGIAMFPDDGTDPDELLRKADAAMYQAKADGRNDFRFFTAQMQARSDRTLTLSNALANAVASDQLEVHYQPLVDLRSGELVGAEALLRWKHPELGSVSPAEFIPVAESSGLILSIGDWVLHRATQAAAGWQAGGHPLRVAVNLSAVQFRHPLLIPNVQVALAQSGLPADLLELELTESLTMGDPQVAQAIMDNLHALGLTLSIDDFGTGYSSLSYLRRLPVEKIKIDQSFVRDIGVDPEDEHIILAIIQLARSLGLKTLAEGVETPAQARFLVEHGCDHMQGWLVKAALPAQDFEHFLSTHVPVPPASMAGR